MSSEEETKPQKKSVAFSDEIDDMENTDGTTTKIDGNGSSAENHTIADTEGAENNVNEKTANGEQAVEAVDENAFDPAKMKKKKKKVVKEDAATEDGAATEDTGFDASLLKKKKKKKAAPDSAFDQKLAEAGVVPIDGEEAPAAPAPVAPQTEEEEADDLEKGTGVWDQSSTAVLRYDQLLKRFFTLLHTQHPDLAGDGRSKSYKIPPPQVLREGNKKTIFANLPEICRKMKRQPEHVIQFLFAELGTSGSVDGNGRLVIKGRFQQKQLENVLRRYIVEYLTCRTCKSPDTVLNKENRLYFITCNSCGSRRSVTTIKIGFQATVGKRKRMQA